MIREPRIEQALGPVTGQAAVRRESDSALGLGRLTEDDRERLFDLSLDLFCVAGFDGYFRRLNPAWEKALDYTTEELLSRPFLDFVHPDDRESTMAETERLARDGTTVHYENRYACKDGSYRWFLWTAFARVDRGQIYAVARDISERKTAQEVLRRSERRIRSLIECAPDSVVLADHRGRIVSANRRVEKMFGHSPEELIDQPIEILLPDALRPAHTRQRSAYFENPAPRAMGSGLKLKGQRKDGSVFPVDVSLGPIKTDEGVQVVATITDATQHRRAEERLRRANAELEARLEELQSLSREGRLLSEMAEMLQSCRAVEETFRVVGSYSRRLFETESGAVYVVSPSRNVVESIARWGEPAVDEETFDLQDCWALRRGRMHVVGDSSHGIPCSHGPDDESAVSVCMPLLAHGEALGIVHLRSASTEAPGGPALLTASRQRLVVSLAEHIALALANLKLRESLRAQSIRDPLTGLFNRRYMEESLDRELARADRNTKSLGVIMLDLDHFKQFNDTFGHDAGDRVLVELGRFLESRTRTEDIVCRYGGEEFAVILPDCELSATVRRAEELCRSLRELRVQFGSRILGPFTMSLGVASFPEHGPNQGALLRMADGALYRAKSKGRDRVVTADDPAHSHGTSD